jgi:hypothetical protein
MKNVYHLLFILLLISCTNHTLEDKTVKNLAGSMSFDSLRWLCANWEMRTPDGILYERWSRENDSVYRGAGYLVSGTDTLFSEKITLEQHAGDLFYIPAVSKQNGGKPVIFRLVSATRGSWIFENPKHDFPQQIIYSHPHPDSLVAVVAGKEKGKARREVFRMGRVAAK